jgi:hypothetical protein
MGPMMTDIIIGKAKTNRITMQVNIIVTMAITSASLKQGQADMLRKGSD